MYIYMLYRLQELVQLRREDGTVLWAALLVCYGVIRLNVFSVVSGIIIHCQMIRHF